MAQNRYLLRIAYTGLFLFTATSAFSESNHLELARQHHVAGEREQALEHYRSYLATKSGDSGERAAAFNNLCLVLHDLGRNDQALEACTSALEMRRQEADETRLARTLNNTGLVLQSSGRWAEARQVYEEALELNRRRADFASVAVNLSNLGWLAGLEGRYGEALERHLEVEALAEQYADQDWASEQRYIAWINRGVVLEKIGAFEQALELYVRLREEREALGPRRWATTLVNLGTVYRNLGDPHQAVDVYRQAAEIFADENDPAALSNAFLNLGQVLHQNLKDLDGAEAAYLDALRLARESNDRGEEIQDLFLLGELYLDQAENSEARHAFEQCLRLAEQSGSAEGAWSALYGLGRTAATAGENSASLEHLQAAIAVIEKTRSGLGDRDLRSDFLASWRRIYELAVEVSWQIFDQEGETHRSLHALALVQHAKERELVEALGGKSLSLAMAQESDPGRLVESLRRRLGEATLVEYFITSDSVFAWRIDPLPNATQASTSGLLWQRVGTAENIARLAGETHAGLSTGKEPTALIELSKLLSAATSDLEELPARLILAPDGALRYVPFEALSTQNGELWLDRAVISYLPSASALLREQEATDRRVTLTGLADPVLLHDGGERSQWTGRFNLSRLPAGRREIEMAAATLDGEHRLLFGAEATASAFRDAAATGSRVIHLAAHTVIDERPGGGAAVLLAADQESAGLLGPEELARLDLQADLTILAACRTALAAPGQTSAFGSLTGAFLAAGSRGVLATLWDVEDSTTQVFMEQFYYQLSQGSEPARALAETKRRLSKDERWSAPHLWSGYVLIGDPPPIVPGRRFGSKLAVLAGLLAVLLTAVWLRKR